MVEDDHRLISDWNDSSFITCELEPGFYNSRDLSETLLKILQPEYEGHHNAIEIEFDDITMKTKLVVKVGIIAIRFDAKSFLVLSWVSTNNGIINLTMNTLARKL